MDTIDYFESSKYDNKIKKKADNKVTKRFQ